MADILNKYQCGKLKITKPREILKHLKSPPKAPREYSVPVFRGDEWLNMERMGRVVECWKHGEAEDIIIYIIYYCSGGHPGYKFYGSHDLTHLIRLT